MKTDYLNVRLTPAEKAKLIAFAESHHISVTAAVRLMIFGGDIQQDINDFKNNKD